MICRRACLLVFVGAVLSAEPRRIVSTAPSITEMLFALGLGDRVVGVTTFCRYPPEAAKRPKIGTYTEPSIEAITALRPDLVIIQKNPIQLQAKLERVGMRVLEVSHDDIEGVYRSIQAIGAAAGVPSKASSLTASMRRDLAAIHARVLKLPPRRIMFVVGRAPNRLEDLVVVGRASYLNELMQLAGGTNIFRDAVAPYPKVGLEELLARDPEVIVDMGDMANTVGVTEEHKRSVVALWNRYPTLTAVRNHRVYAVAADIYVVPGPRMVQAAGEFARILHPEAGR